QLEHRQLRGFRPAGDRHLAVARIKPNGDFAGEVARRLLDEGRIAHRGGADDHPGHTLVEPRFHRRGVADAAAELHRDADGLKDAVDGVGVDRLAGEGAVEIDHVQILKSLLLEGARLRRRIAMENRRARGIALLQTHGEAVLEIDRGKEDHGFHFRKFAISWSPSFWLFSGWNCVPTMLSRPTIAVSGPP